MRTWREYFKELLKGAQMESIGDTFKSETIVKDGEKFDARFRD